MAANPYYNPNPANWWHGDEMFEGRSSTVVDVWHTWETGAVDDDGWGVSEWIEDIRRSDYFGDMDEATLKELMRFIAKNRLSPELKNLAQYTHDYIDATLEG